MIEGFTSQDLIGIMDETFACLVSMLTVLSECKVWLSAMHTGPEWLPSWIWLQISAVVVSQLLVT